MEINEDIVIVGAGIAGLSTSLGLQRVGVKSLVLESSDSLRITGFALTLWTNAWRALDAVGIGDTLRQKFPQINAFEVASPASGRSTSEVSLGIGSKGSYESRCVERKVLLETLENELPHGTIRYSSKVVSIEESGCFKLLQLADGSVIRTKVLIGCDGVNSMVGKWLGLEKPVSAKRSAIRGLVQCPNGHGFKPRIHVYFGGRVRYGFIPCNDTSLYWFCTFTPSSQDDEGLDEDPIKMKQFVLSKLIKAPQEMVAVVERTQLDAISCSPLKLRLPWNLLWGNIVKGNVCVAGDALHPMTPDIGQGGCSALEDSVILARCLGQAMLAKPRQGTRDESDGDKEEYERITRGLDKFAKERRWRSFSLISAAYIMGVIQESDGKLISFLREKVLPGSSVGAFVYMADFDCGKLTMS